MTYKNRYEYQKEIILKQKEEINRQKAEIERLEKNLANISVKLELAWRTQTASTLREMVGTCDDCD